MHQCDNVTNIKKKVPRKIQTFFLSPEFPLKASCVLTHCHPLLQVSYLMLLKKQNKFKNPDLLKVKNLDLLTGTFSHIEEVLAGVLLVVSWCSGRGSVRFCLAASPLWALDSPPISYSHAWQGILKACYPEPWKSFTVLDSVMWCLGSYPKEITEREKKNAGRRSLWHYL